MPVGRRAETVLRKRTLEIEPDELNTGLKYVQSSSRRASARATAPNVSRRLLPDDLPPPFGPSGR
jgi:hypothetical protein